MQPDHPDSYCGLSGQKAVRQAREGKDEGREGKGRSIVTVKRGVRQPPPLALLV